ncbi:MAG: hypothetical protein JXA37_13055 [Chloroflexia bacterium]|nr:hypothetical protein [Chloroflexia bacterium]
MATNLDAHCARCATDIVALSGASRDKELENRLNNALGVLQEDGFFAFYLYLKYRKLDQPPQDVWAVLAGLLQDESVGAPLGAGEYDRSVVEMTGDLQKLLLAKQLTERSLVYARYGIRSLPGG